MGRRHGSRLLWTTALGVVLALAVSSCSSTPEGPLPEAPTPITLDELTDLTHAGSATVVNVWASWCLPCRSEAPLLAKGSNVYPDVAFIGLKGKDTPEGAQSFMAEYLADGDMDHYASISKKIVEEEKVYIE